MAKNKFSLIDGLLNDQSREAGVFKEGKKLFAIQQLPLENIMPSPNNEYGMRDIELLAASIFSMGLLHNIVVRKAKGTHLYEIVSGERRYRAYKFLFEEGNLEYQTIPCKVEAESDDIFAEYQLLQANAMARELTDYEKSYQGIRPKNVLVKLRELGLLKVMQSEGKILKGRLRDAVANMMDVSPSQMKIWEGIHKNLIPRFMAEFKEERIGITSAYDLSTLSSDDQHAVLAEYIVHGQDAIREFASKPMTKADANGLPLVPDDNQVDTSAEPAPPSTAINTQKQSRNQHVNASATPSPKKPLKGTNAQYQSLLSLGIEAKLNLSYVNSTLDKTKYTERLKAFALVAEEFGFEHKLYMDDLDAILLKETLPQKS